MSTDTDSRHLFYEDQLAQLARHTLLGLAGSLINLVVLVTVLWGETGTRRLLLWSAGLLIISMIRIRIQWRFGRYRKSKASLDRWKVYFLISLAISGGVWGASGIFLFPPHSVAHQSLIAFVLGGMIAGVVGVFSVLPMAFVLFSIPALLPFICRCIQIGDPIHLSMAGMLSLFWLIMALTVRRLNKDLLRSIRLKYENIDLIDSLKTEVAARKATEEKLVRQKSAIEDVVASRTAELQTANIRLNREVEERVKANRDLEKSEQKFRTLVENINDVIYSVGLDGIITYISPSIQPAIGYLPSDVVGTPFAEYVHPEDIELIQALFRDAIAGRGGHNEYRIRSKNGTTHWIRSSSRPVYHGLEVIGLTGVFMDITERKQLENQRVQLEARLMQARKLESIGILAGGIAHNLNNMLAPMIGFAELALDQAETGSETEDALQEIYAAGMRAKEAVEQILTFARQSKDAVQPVPVSVVARQVLDILDGSLSDTIDIRSTIVSQSKVMGNPDQIHQVLMAFGTNAVQAMEDQGGILTVAVDDVVIDTAHELASHELTPGKYARILFSDTGPGISTVNLNSIFDPYFTTKDVGQGVGMGLSMAHGIVDNHGGKIMVRSEAGKGAEFTVFLPVIENRS